jgi:hypothetical protein
MPYYIPLTIVFIVQAPVVEEPVKAIFEPVTITVNEIALVFPKSVVIVSVKLIDVPN